MALVIPDEIIQATRMTEQEVAQALAITLFQREKLTLGQAARLAGITQFEFQQLLASHGISLHYDVADFEQDVATLRDMGRL
jgi:predicted HTH domain antitoxin